MSTNRLTRAAVMGKDTKEKPTLALPIGSSGENQNKKRSRDDLDQTDDQVDNFDVLLMRMKQLIADGNARIEQKIDSNNAALVTEIASLRKEVNQLKSDCARDFKQMCEVQTKTEVDVLKNKDAINRLAKSADLILTGVPYNQSENTENIVKLLSYAIGYSESDCPPVYTKRLARTPIATGATPPILLQFAFKAFRDEFFFRYLSKKNLNMNQLGFEIDKRVFLNENLTESARRIKSMALKLKNSGRIKNVYSKDGTIYVKLREDDAAQPVFDVGQLKEFEYNQK